MNKEFILPDDAIVNYSDPSSIAHRLSELKLRNLTDKIDSITKNINNGDK